MAGRSMLATSTPRSIHEVADEFARIAIGAKDESRASLISEVGKIVVER